MAAPVAAAKGGGRSSMVLVPRQSVFLFGLLPYDNLGLAQHASAPGFASVLRWLRDPTVATSSIDVLKLTSWISKAQQQLKCSEACCRLYFDLFVLVHLESSGELASSSDSAEAPTKALLAVDMAEFLLFLFLQRTWPLFLEQERVRERAVAESIHGIASRFVRTFVADIVGLVRDPVKQLAQPPGGRSPVGDEDKSEAAMSLSRHEFNRLGFILKPMLKGVSTHVSPREAARQQQRQLSDYWQAFSNPQTQIPFGEVCSWILHHLPHVRAPSTTISPRALSPRGISPLSSTPPSVSPPGTAGERSPLAAVVNLGAQRIERHQSGGASSPSPSSGHSTPTQLYPPSAAGAAAGASAASSTAASGSASPAPAEVLTDGSVRFVADRQVEAIVLDRTAPANKTPQNVCLVRVLRCTVLFPLRSLCVEATHCAHSLLNLGVCDLLHVRHCSHLKLCVAARFVHISDCTDCVFFLHSLNRPVVMGNCKNIKLAPYNAPAYPGMFEDLQRAQFPRGSTSRWSTPVHLAPPAALPPMSPRTATPLSPRSSSTLSTISSYAGTDPSLASLLSPAFFFPFPSLATTPPPASPHSSSPSVSAAKSPRDFGELPFELPGVYREALVQRRQQALAVRRMVDEAALTAEEKEEFQRRTSAEFTKWLQTACPLFRTSVNSPPASAGGDPM